MKKDSSVETINTMENIKELNMPVKTIPMKTRKAYKKRNTLPIDKRLEVAAKSTIRNRQELSKEYNISTKQIDNIVKNSLKLKEQFENKLIESMAVGAGVVGNQALEKLSKRNLNKENARTLSTIAVDMHKIATGNNGHTFININNTIPTTREELLTWLQPKVLDAETVDNSPQVE